MDVKGIDIVCHLCERNFIVSLETYNVFSVNHLRYFNKLLISNDVNPHYKIIFR